MAYCTILSTNYLAKALTLADTLQRHHPGARLTVLVIDSADAAHLAGIQQPGVEIVGTDVLGLPHRDVLRLATIYDLVELATAVKPLLLKALLADAEQAAYLDPDTYVTSPMVELSPDLEATDGGILLTPHFLDPVPPGAELTEGHLLTVGVYNLGFCAVDRRALRLPRLVVGAPRARVPVGPAVRAVRRPEVVRHRVGDLPGRGLAAPGLQRQRGQPARAADRPR